MVRKSETPPTAEAHRGVPIAALLAALLVAVTALTPLALPSATAQEPEDCIQQERRLGNGTLYALLCIGSHTAIITYTTTALDENGPPGTFGATTCDGAFNGAHAPVGDRDPHACASVDVEPPQGGGKDNVPGSKQADEAGDAAQEATTDSVRSDPCPGSAIGSVVLFSGPTFHGHLRIAACFIYSYVLPSRVDGDPSPEVDLEDCMVNGFDPTVHAWDGGVAFCVVLVVDNGIEDPLDPPPLFPLPTPIGPPGDPGDDNAPIVGYDLTPCPGGTDPEVTVAGARVVVCLQYDLGVNYRDDIPKPLA